MSMGQLGSRAMGRTWFFGRLAGILVPAAASATELVHRPDEPAGTEETTVRAPRLRLAAERVHWPDEPAGVETVSSDPGYAAIDRSPGWVGKTWEGKANWKLQPLPAGPTGEAAC